MSIEDIKSNYYIEEVIGRYINLKPQGPEMVGNCIFHDDDHASLKVNKTKKIFKCFACGEGGDIFDFFTAQGLDMKTDYQKIVSLITNDIIIHVKRPEEKPPEMQWTNAIPNQQNLPDVASLTFKDYGKPSMFWEYDDMDVSGNRIVTGYVLRFDLPDGKKDVIPYTFKTNGKIAKWQWRGFDIPRPLYNLYQLKKNPDAMVLMVEGEKTAEAGRKMFQKYVTSTWIGGGENIKNADLSPLKDRNVYLWPDNDVPGIHCMFGGWAYNEKSQKYRRIKGLCEIIEANFKWIKNSLDFPKKWDIADASWTPEEAFKYLKENRSEVPTVSDHAPNESPVLPEASYSIQDLSTPEVTRIVSAPAEAVPVVQAKHEPPRNESPVKSSQTQNPYFRCYGFEKENDHLVFVFFSYRTNMVIKMSANGMSTSSLLQLAPLQYWEGNYPKATRSGPKFDINIVADHLTSVCSNIGFFDSNKIRGRGAWRDGENTIIHCGNVLIVNGQLTHFKNHSSKYIYEAGKELEVSTIDPLSKTEAYQFITILERLNWNREINARLLAGWIVIAPLCGAMTWRPHIWLTGPSGSGKSWVMNFCVKKLLGKMFIDAQGATTEAGIRQALQSDALPVTFDEAEPDGKKGLERMESNLELARASSTSESGDIIKGSSVGTASQYKMKSCFAFSSINPNLVQRSDISRNTVLELKSSEHIPNRKEIWKETSDMYGLIVTPEYRKRFQARAFKMLPVILKNAETFSTAAASVLDNQRTGDQLGALLAGAFSLTSDAVISFEDAKKWIKEKDWSEERMAESTKDEVKVLHQIISAEIGVETISYGKRTSTIGELIMIINGQEYSEIETGTITIDVARITLKRAGIRVDDKYILISDTSDFIGKRLLNTGFSKSYHTIISRIHGAEKVDNITFGGYMKTRATKIETETVFGQIERVKIPDAEIALHSSRHQNVQNDLFSK